MPKFRANLLDRTGIALADATIAVYRAGTSSLATIHSDRAMATVVPGSTLTTDADGEFQFFAPNGEYKYTFEKNGVAGEEDYVLLAGLPLAFNIRDYGATGDDAADDTAAIQATIDEAEAAGGGIVFLPPGAYKVSTLVVDSTGVLLIGAGMQATQLVTTATTGNIISFGNTGAAYNSAGGIRDLTITSSVTRTAGFGIAVDGCEDGIINNVKVITTGGGGMVFGASGASVSGRWFVSQCVVGLTGAFVGMSFKGNNDRYVTDCWISGNQAVGSKAIEVSGTAGDWFTNVEAVLCEIGVDVTVATGKTNAFLSFTNVLADQNAKYGWRITSTGGTNRSLQLIGCWAGTNGAADINARGMLLESCSGLMIVNPRVQANGGHGIEVGAGVSGLLIDGGLVAGNSAASSGTAHGIAIANGVSGYRIIGVRSGQSAGMPNSQGYGISLGTGNDNFIIANNDIRTNVTGALNNATGVDATKIVAGNLGVAGQTIEGGLVVNEAGADVDTRFEGDTEQNLLFLDAGNDRVGVGTGSPTQRLDVLKTADENVLLVVRNASTGTSALGGVRAQGDVAIVNFQAHGSGRVATRFGKTIASWTELLAVAGNGLILGTLGAAPLVLGTNSTSCLEIDSAGRIAFGIGSPRWMGFSSTAADPTTTELPADKDFGLHKNTSSSAVFLAYNDGGAIKKVALT